MKHLLKSLYYALNPVVLDPGMDLRMGYIFHTEAIHDDSAWPLLLRFCREFRLVTGVEPICTIMTPRNARVARQMHDAGVTADDYLTRVRELETVAVIGHHGHYYTDPESYSADESEIRGRNYSRSAVEEQFQSDLDWFREHGIDHHGLYAGGWWFSHPDLVALLIREGYRIDFTFTSSPVFGHDWSRGVMQRGGIRFGETFRLATDDGDIALVQNLIGCHNTPFVEDFVRHMNTLVDPDWPEVTGVVNTHDFNLVDNYDFTFAVLRSLAEQSNVSFWGREMLDQVAADREMPTLNTYR